MNNKFGGFAEMILKSIVQKLFRRSLDEEQYDSIMQFFKFCIIGLSNTVISYVIYIVVLLLLQRMKLFPVIDYLFAQFVGFILSVLWSFYWNNKYVFKDEEGQRNLLYALFKTYISYAFTGLFLNSILSLIWVEIFQCSKLVAPIINLLVSVPLNFIINKFWAFK